MRTQPSLVTVHAKACLCRSGGVGADPLTRTVGVAVRGSVGDASRRHGGFLRAHGALTPPAPRAGPCQARAWALRAGEGYGPSIRRCAGRPGQDAPVPEPSILRRQKEAGRESCEAFLLAFCASRYSGCLGWGTDSSFGGSQWLGRSGCILQMLQLGHRLRLCDNARLNDLASS